MKTIARFWWRLRRMWALRWYWSTGDFDWTVAADLLRHQIHRLRIHMGEHAIFPTDDNDRLVRQMLITEHLLDRMANGSIYYRNADAIHPNSPTHWAKMVNALEKQDEEMLAIMLRKHLRSWWD